MDEMKITSKFMRNVLSKIVNTALRKKTGYDICIQLNDANARFADGKARIHMDIDAEVETAELIKILKSIGLV